MSRLRDAWESYWFMPVSRVRVFLFVRVIALILSIDVVFTHVSHASRYGAGGFNVAHFGILDTLLPSGLSARGYIALLLLASASAFGVAVIGFAQLGRELDGNGASLGARLSRGLLVVTTLCYTLAWSSSMLDSYQHHYLLSILLLCMCAFPGHVLASAKGQGVNWPWPLLAVSVAIVYGYAAWAKLEPAWWSGAALPRVAGASLDELEHSFGLSQPQLTAGVLFVSRTVSALQIALALAYLAAPVLHRSKLGGGLALAAWLLALSFHLGAELMGLKIGWFSYYMMWTATVFLVPEAWLTALAKPFLWVRRAQDVSGSASQDLQQASLPMSEVWLMLLPTGIVLAAAGWWADLPGSALAFALVGLALLVAALLGGRLTRTNTSGPVRKMLLTLTAASAAWAVIITGSLAVSEVRYDYYRYAGGAHARMGEWREAYQAYQKANRYAPPGKDRLERLREAERQLNHPH